MSGKRPTYDSAKEYPNTGYPWPQYYDCPDCGTRTPYDTDCEECHPRTATERWQDSINAIINDSRGMR